MTKRSTGKMRAGGMTRLRRGTQELLERRSMTASTAPLKPQLHTDGPAAARSEPYFGDAVFSHGGRRAGSPASPLGSTAHHVELPGHRHRGAEQHSKH
jgi:hypothetical protein